MDQPFLEEKVVQLLQVFHYNGILIFHGSAAMARVCDNVPICFNTMGEKGSRITTNQGAINSGNLGNYHYQKQKRKRWNKKEATGNICPIQPYC